MRLHIIVLLCFFCLTMGFRSAKSKHKPQSLSPSLNCESDGEEYVLCFIVIWTNLFDDLSCSYANRPGITEQVTYPALLNIKSVGFHILLLSVTIGYCHSFRSYKVQSWKAVYISRRCQILLTFIFELSFLH